MKVPQIVQLIFLLVVTVSPCQSWSSPRGVSVVPRGDSSEAVPTTSGKLSVSYSGGGRALVIGNSKYAISPLRNPANDAQDIAEALTHLGFSVTMIIDAGKESILLAIDKFGRDLKPGEIGVFYYAGHGMQIDGKNYLIPVNTGSLRSQGDIPYLAVNAQLVIDRMDRAGNMMNIVILDACRDNPFASDDNFRPRGLAQMDAPKGTLIVYATKPGSTAEDGIGRNGVFTRNLLKQINRNEDVQLMLRRVRNGVFEETHGKQTPWDEGTLVAGFSFSQNREENYDTIESARQDSQRLQFPQRRNEEQQLPRSFCQRVVDVEVSGTSQNGELSLVFTSSGMGNSIDPFQWRVAAEKDAMKKVKRATSVFLTSPPYSLSEQRSEELFRSGKVISAEFADEVRKLTVKYQIRLDDRYH